MPCGYCENDANYVCDICGSNICQTHTTIADYYLCPQCKIKKYELVVESGGVGIEIELEKGDYKKAFTMLDKLNKETKPIPFYKVGKDSGLLFGGLEISTNCLSDIDYLLDRIRAGIAISTTYGFSVPNKSRCAIHVNIPIETPISINTLFGRLYELIGKHQKNLLVFSKSQRLKMFDITCFSLGDILTKSRTSNPRGITRYFPISFQAVRERYCLEYRFFASTTDIEEIRKNIELSKKLHKFILSKKAIPVKLSELFNKLRLTAEEKERWTLLRDKYLEDIDLLGYFDISTWGYQSRWGYGTQ